MNIITINVNGIRSAARKGFFDWITAQNADVICLQEVRADEAILLDPVFTLSGYHAYFSHAEKKGYSGVGIYSRHPAQRVVKTLGFETADREGRYVAIDIGKLWVASIYLPSGTSGDARQLLKYDFLDRLLPYLRKIREENCESIICGDWNIAHQERDLKNWRANQKNSGFLPEERAWLDRLFQEVGFVDAFRVINQASDQYTWWSNRGRARALTIRW